MGDEMEQDVGGEVVGQVSDDEELFVGMGFRVVREGGEVDVEDVVLEDFDVGLGGETFAEARGEFAVELDGDEASGAGSEQICDGGLAGADFDDGAMGEIAECVDDGMAGRGAGEEVLAELGFDVGGNGVAPCKGARF